MPFRFRRSIKVAPGVRLSVSKSGVGASVGGKGARYSVHSSGRRTASVGIPGTGLGYTKSVSGGSKKRSSSAASEAQAAPRSLRRSRASSHRRGRKNFTRLSPPQTSQGWWKPAPGSRSTAR
jgi:Protein of unknown function (DUF4236)